MSDRPSCDHLTRRITEIPAPSDVAKLRALANYGPGIPETGAIRLLIHGRRKLDPDCQALNPNVGLALRCFSFFPSHPDAAAETSTHCLAFRRLRRLDDVIPAVARIGDRPHAASAIAWSSPVHWAVAQRRVELPMRAMMSPLLSLHQRKRLVASSSHPSLPSSPKDFC